MKPQKRILPISSLLLALLAWPAASQGQIPEILCPDPCPSCPDPCPDLVPRGYYLTKSTFTGSAAPAACIAGFHMASLWEIFDTSNLKYNTGLGLTDTDSGMGPPANSGWIRTGLSGFTFPNPGFANCSAYTSSSSSAHGTIVLLSSTWTGDANTTPEIHPWKAFAITCSTPNRVWCVAD